ncbi:MAG: TIGR04222 domain-containing membrane protein [Magnetococcus sp. YQC-5]
MINTLARVPGPEFLNWFLPYAIFLVILAWFLNRYDQTWSRMLPSLNSYDADTLAYLEGGIMGVVRTSVFRLWRLGVLGRHGPTDTRPNRPLSGIDQQTLNTLRGVMPTRSADLLLIKDRLRSHVDPLASRLENAGLIYDAMERKRHRTILIVISFLLWGIGGTKFFLGVFNHRPVLLLFMILIVAQLLIILIGRQAHHRTTLGRKYLKAIRHHFAWLQAAGSRQNDTPDSDLALGAALFGWAFLMNFPGSDGIFAGLNTSSSTFSGDGGGGGCGGGDSGDGGGGGCGGCGGGD